MTNDDDLTPDEEAELEVYVSRHAAILDSIPGDTRITDLLTIAGCMVEWSTPTVADYREAALLAGLEDLLSDIDHPAAHLIADANELLADTPTPSTDADVITGPWSTDPPDGVA